jgi:hypothetical protein
LSILIPDIFEPDSNFGRTASSRGVANYRLNQFDWTTQYYVRSVFLVPLAILPIDSEKPHQYCTDSASGDYPVRIDHLSPPSLRWTRIAGGTAILFDAFILYFAIILFASHDITLVTLIGLTIADLVGFAVVWRGLGFLFG